MKFKKLFIQLLSICVLFLLTSCIYIPPTIGGDTPVEPETEYPFELTLDLCSYDFYQIKDDMLEMPLDTYTIEVDNPVVASMSKSGYITTYTEGSTYIYLENTLDDDYNTVIKLNTEKGIKVDYIDVGQGDAILISLPNGEVMMIDAGAGLYYDEMVGWSNIKKTFEKRGINTIDHLVVSHHHGDHYGQIPNVVRNYRVLNYYDSGSVRSNWQYLDVMNSITKANINKEIVKVGDIIVEDTDLIVQVVGVQQNVSEDDENINYESVMIRIEYQDVAYMFTGDAGYRTGDCENVALNSGLNLKSDVLKVGHHGSKTSSGEYFINEMNLKYSIISIGKNNRYGHSNKEVLDNLNDSKIYRTDQDGSIMFKIKNNKLEIEICLQ